MHSVINFKIPIFISPQDETQITNHKSEGHPEENTKDSIQEQEESVTSYEPAPEASKGNQTMAGRYYTFHHFLSGASSEPPYFACEGFSKTAF